MSKRWVVVLASIFSFISSLLTSYIERETVRKDTFNAVQGLTKVVLSQHGLEEVRRIN